MDSRLATHGALADQHRLAIADALAASDLTPGALAATLGLSTNLMAHHLSVLEAAGVVTRHRSEADKRRSYVSLRWDNPIVAASVTPPAAVSAPRVVFVCTHNSARSHMAASMFADICSLPVTSAGTEPAAQVHPHAVAALHARGLRPLSAHPQQLDDVAREGDMLVAVCDNAFETLASTDPADLHWSIPDPAATRHPSTSIDPFAEALLALEPRVKRLAASLTPGALHV